MGETQLCNKNENKHFKKVRPQFFSHYFFHIFTQNQPILFERLRVKTADIPDTRITTATSNLINYPPLNWITDTAAYCYLILLVPLYLNSREMCRLLNHSVIVITFMLAESDLIKRQRTLYRYKKTCHGTKKRIRKDNFKHFLLHLPECLILWQVVILLHF